MAGDDNEQIENETTEKPESQGKPDAHQRLADRIEKAAKAEPPDDGGEDDAPEPEERPKKRNRWQEMNAVKDDAMRRAELAEKRAAEAEERAMRALRLVEERAAPQAPKKDEDDAEKQALEGLRREQQLLYRELRLREGSLTQADLERIERRNNEIEEQKLATVARREMRAMAGQQQSQPSGHPLTPFLQMQFPDVFAVQDGRGLRWARSWYEQQVLEGREETPDLIVAAYREARRRFNPNHPEVKGQRKPDPNAAARMTGQGAGPAGGAGDGGGERVAEMSAAQRKMANSMYSHLPTEEARYAAWKKGPGARLQKKLSA